jgi:oligopeptide/dipeptide ABC transporter ATP-binding protein
MRLSYILITHDLSVAKNISDRIAVMYLGMIVEEAQASVLFENPIHPYTKALISAIPVITEEEKLLLPAEIILDGEIPSPSNLPYTCPFFSRCQEKSSKCRENVCPDLREVEKGHQVRCSI